MMERVMAAPPPPLPPKTRRSPSAGPTVLDGGSVGTSAEVFDYTFPQGTATGNHVVKILIKNGVSAAEIIDNSSSARRNAATNAGGVRISVGKGGEVPQTTFVGGGSEGPRDVDAGGGGPPYFFCGPFVEHATSGQVSPSDTLDSGTCSDLDGTPPPLPKKKGSSSSGVSVTHIGGTNGTTSLTGSDTDDDEDVASNVSYDSLNGKPKKSSSSSVCLPRGLLRDIRNVKLTRPRSRDPDESVVRAQQVILEDDDDLEELAKDESCVFVDECTYEDRRLRQRQDPDEELAHADTFDTDSFYNFHLCERDEIDSEGPGRERATRFADLLAGGCGPDASSTIRSAKGTIRGVRNRVRAGIAAFLQINATAKSYKEKDAGKVVVYTTTMGIVRETFNNCAKVKQILKTLLVKFEERDVFMSFEYQTEIRDRMRSDDILVPQVFVDGQHVGDAETIEKLNESGQLREILKPYKSRDACTTCKFCGGYRLLLCPVCSGSKKSVHRNDFTAEFVALKCMNCDEAGLVRCSSC